MSSEMSPQNEKQVNRGIAILQKGGVIAFPTDTVYALAAAFDDTAAVERIYQLKQRPLSKAFPLLAADESQLEMIAAEIPETARLLIKRLTLAELTLVLKKSSAVPDAVTGGFDTVAVRMPAHPVAWAIVKGLGKPAIGTSANISGKKSALTADEVSAQFGDKLDLIISGECTGGKASTIIDVSGAKPKILREGAMPRQRLEQLLGRNL